MTIETIIAQLNRIAADSDYDIFKSKSEIWLTINDFIGFDDSWEETFREFEDADAVIEVLAWLRDNADSVEDTFCRRYHFGDWTVVVGYTSHDI